MVTSNVKQLRGRLSLVRRTCALVWGASRKWTVAWVVTLVVRGAIPGGMVYVTKWLVDSIAAAIGGGLDPANIHPVLGPVAVMGILLVAQQVLDRMAGWIQTAQAEHVQDHIKRLIHRKAASVDYGFFEAPEFFDLLQQADSQAGAQSLGLFQNVGRLLQNGITFVSIALIVALYAWWLPLVLLVGTLPAFLIVVRHNRRYHSWWKATTRDRRWAGYLDLLFIQPLFAGEMRLYDLADHLSAQYDEVRGRLRDERLKLSRAQTFAGIVAALQALVVTAGVMGWLIWRAFRGLASLGDLALFYQAINQGQSLIRSLLGGVGEIYTNTLFIEHLFRLLEMEPRLAEPEEPVPFPSRLHDGIRFQNVSFSYPESARPALEDFDLHVPVGKIVAVVGPNGAGKSTLVKLLCRFYDPDGGCVTVDGIDMRCFEKRALRRHISVMFQHPVRYQASVRDNIQLADITADGAGIIAAAEGAEAHGFVERLPEGYDTLLGRLFPGGTELSGGEWQRIALARAYFRQAPIIVLDEPTSSMDSWAEVVWLRQFKELARGRTAMVITHRFTTAMQADLIYVMDQGRLVESGTHQELVALGGQYAASWREQMQQAEYAGGDGGPSVEKERP